MAREIKIAILGDSKGFAGAIADTDSRLGRLGSSFASFGKVAAVGLAAATAGAVALGKSFYDAAIESQKVTKQTEAVLKSMGGAANVTAKQVGDLSTKLSMQTGIDDEVIQSGENVLLTFGKVRNEAGKGNDIFNRTTKAALDMSVALGTDLKGANIQLGKAMNDPVKGMNALTRSGVSFTQQQKDQVKALVESGRTLDAQKLILGEVEKQFKGSAAAQATAGEKLKVVWGNIQETIGAKLIPVVEAAANALAKVLPAALDVVGRALRPLVGYWQSFVGAFQEKDTFGFTSKDGLVGQVLVAGKKVRETFDSIKGYWQSFVGAFQEKDTFGMTSKDGFVYQVLAAGKAAREFVDGFKANWSKIAPIVAGVGIAIAALAAPFATLAAGLAILYIKSETFRSTVNALAKTLVTVVAGAIDVVMVLWSNFGNNLLDLVQRIWPRIQQIIGGALSIIQGIVKTITSLIHGDWSGVWDGIKQVVTGAWSAIQGIVGGALEVLRAAIGVVLEVIGSMFKGAWDAVTSTVSSAVGAVVGFVVALPGRIVSALASLGRLLVDLHVKAFLMAKDAMVQTVQTALEWLKGLPKMVVDAVGDLGKVLFDAGKKLIGGFIDGIKHMAGAVKDTLGGITNKLTSWKGPPQVDARILVDNGRLVMEGFVKGLQQGMGQVKAALGGVTASLPQMVGVGSAPLSAGGSFIGGPTFVNITVQDSTDPQRTVEAIEQAMMRGALFGPATQRQIRAA